MIITASFESMEISFLEFNMPEIELYFLKDVILEQKENFKS